MVTEFVRSIQVGRFGYFRVELKDKSDNMVPWLHGHGYMVT